MFTSSRPWFAEGVQGLVVYCSDGRWTEAFEEFIRSGLRLRRCDRYVIPGGPACLTLKAYQAAREYLTFLVREHEIRRIVLIAHTGCTYFGRLTGMDPDRCSAEQQDDLRQALAVLQGWFPDTRAEAYVARRVGSVISFQRLPDR